MALDQVPGDRGAHRLLAMAVLDPDRDRVAGEVVLALPAAAIVDVVAQDRHVLDRAVGCDVDAVGGVAG